MTREEQRSIAARKYADDVYADEQTPETIEDFWAGAAWADSHPHWIPVEKALPPHKNKTNHKFENDFSVSCFVSDGRDVDAGYYDYRLRKWNCEFLTNVVYWYCPQPPRKEE